MQPPPLHADVPRDGQMHTASDMYTWALSQGFSESYANYTTLRNIATGLYKDEGGLFMLGLADRIANAEAEPGDGGPHVPPKSHSPEISPSAGAFQIRGKRGRGSATIPTSSESNASSPSRSAKRAAADGSRMVDGSPHGKQSMGAAFTGAQPAALTKKEMNMCKRWAVLNQQKRWVSSERDEYVRLGQALNFDIETPPLSRGQRDVFEGQVLKNVHCLFW